MSDALTWLEAREAGIPASLAMAMKTAVQQTRGEVAEARGPTDQEAFSAPERPPTPAVADALAGAGLALLKEVAAGEGRRDSARALLAADALITLACEAAAENPSALDHLLDQLDVARFEAVLEEVTS